jgi:hypothetical protein
VTHVTVLAGSRVGERTGCDRHLVKPIAVQTLNKVLHELVPEQMLSIGMAAGAFTALAGPAPTEDEP